MTYIGFGVVMDNAKWKDDAGKTLVKGYGFVSEEYGTYCKDNDLDPKGGFEDEFIQDYQTDEGDLGPEHLLTDIINNEKFGGREVFIYRDSVIHVPATIPKNAKEKENLPTQEDITRILKKYLEPVLASEVETDWFDIED